MGLGDRWLPCREGFQRGMGFVDVDAVLIQCVSKPTAWPPRALLFTRMVRILVAVGRRDFADHPAGIPCRDHAGRDIPVDDASCPDDGLLPTVTPGNTVTFAPNHTLSPMVIGATYS